MKKGLTITLLVIFFLHNAGWYIVYKLSARQVKQEVKAYLATHPGVADVVFTFRLVNGKPDDASFQWEEYGKEFMYQGSMYDVVSCAKSNGNLVIKCINDKKEKELKGLLAKMNAKNRSRLQVTYSPYVHSSADYAVRPLDIYQSGYNLLLEEKIPLLHLPLVSPPPDVL